MEHKRSKHILYTICTICIALLDWTRGSQRGDIWIPAVNLVGVFILAIALLHRSRKKQKLVLYLVWLPIWAACSAMGYPMWKNRPGDVFPSQYWIVAVSVLLAGIVAIRIWNERKENAKRGLGNKFILLCWIAMSVLMTCSRMGEIWPIGYVVFFLLFYATPFSKEERGELWNGVADGLIAVFFGLQIFAYGFRPYDVVRYSGAYVNCNMAALFYMVTYVALLYRMHSIRWQEKKEGVENTWLRKGVKLILWMLIAGMWGFVLLTMTRTAMIMIILITLLYGILEFGCIYREKIYRTFFRMVALCVSIVVLFPVVYLTARHLPTILHYPVWFEGEYTPLKVHSFDPADSYKYISFEEVMERLFYRLGIDWPDSLSEVRMSDGEMVLLASNSVLIPEEQMLSPEEYGGAADARLLIWKLYLQNLNLTGHELTEGYFQIAETYHAWHAQNVFIQMAFYYGVIAGILFVVVMLGLGIHAMICAVKSKRCEDILPILVGALFVGYGMLECVWYPGQIILTLVYMVPKILIDSYNDKRKALKEV